MRILCVHQGFELYGSDRCFLDSVRVIRASFPHAHVAAVIPRPGPITAPLSSLVDHVTFGKIWVLRKHGLWKSLLHGPISLPVAVARAVTAFRSADLVYINTVTVLDYLLAAAFFRSKALLHIHEAPGGLAGVGFGALVRSLRAATIFNSEATRSAYRPSRKAPSYVLYNGVDAPDVADPCRYDGSRRLRILMIGRISRGKAQDLLLDACERLPASVIAKIEVKIVGSSFGRRRQLEQLLIARARKIVPPDVFSFEPFTADPAKLYEWCDLVIVPSRVREGFGRVATEAMAHGRAVIAANHGGLTEIVEHEKTGWLFTPNDPAALAEVIQVAAASPDQLRQFGRAARRRFDTHFAAPLIDSQLRKILRERCP